MNAERTSVAPEDVPEQWDFYLAKVDDAPASIFLNMAYGQLAPLDHVGAALWCEVPMRDPEDHGMGSPQDADRLVAMEDDLCERAAGEGFHPVGRLRSAGVWTIFFYGADGTRSRFDEVVSAVTAAHAIGEYETGTKPDAGWSLYREFLLPDAERWRWMNDRRVVDALRDHGDLSDRPRRVDHWVYFASADDRDRFVEQAAAEGFSLESAHKNDESALPFAAQMFKEDAVELEHIHAVVMSLVELAEAHDGDYDGWETFIVKPE